MSVMLLGVADSVARILVFGGQDAATNHTYEVIDVSSPSPATSWSAPIPFPDGVHRSLCSAVLLPDGTVIRALATEKSRSWRATACPPAETGAEPVCAALDDQGPPMGEPSALCRAQSGTPVPPQHALDEVDFWAYVSQPATGRVNVCVRAELGEQVAGGRLEVTTDGSTGVTPHIDASSTDVSTAQCPNQLQESGTIDRIYVNDPGSNPIKVCVTLLGTSRRIEIGTTSSPTNPFARWIPDTDSPLTPAIEIP